LTRDDFSNLNSLDFHLPSDVIASKCGNSFSAVFLQIPLEDIGVTPLPVAPSDQNSPANRNPNPSSVSDANNTSGVTFGAIIVAAFVLLNWY